MNRSENEYSQPGDEVITIRPVPESIIPQNSGVFTIDFLSNCIQKGAVRKTTDGEVTIAFDKVWNILEHFRTPDGYFKEKKESDDSFTLPAEIDLQKQCQDTVRAVIHTAYRDLGLLDAKTLSNAVRFGGPGNTVFAQKYSSLFLTMYAKKLYEENTWNRQDPLPPPNSTKERNEAPTALFIGRPAITSYTNAYLHFAEKSGVSLSEDQALQLSMTHIAAHEFGHAVKYALDADSRSIRRSAEILSENTWLDQVRSMAPSILTENFTQGFAMAVKREYAKKQLGMTDEDITKLLREEEYNAEGFFHAIDELVTYARIHDISVVELINTDIQIAGHFDNFEEYRRSENSYLYSIIAYALPAYSPDEIRTLTGVSGTS